MSSSRFVGVLVALLAVGASGCARVKRFGYEGFGRDGWQQPEKVIDSLGIRAGDRIADVGAGGGYFTFRLAEATGPEGRVYAVDVDRDMTEYLRERARDEGAENVEVILAEYHDPLLPEAGVDLVFVCNTYHHIEERSDYFANVQKYLRPGGRVAIVEYVPQGWFQRIFPHSTSAEEIRREMEQAGYDLEQEHGFLSRQSFLVFTKREG
ncbi:MAG: class I SAM-dependent methyltransferase [Myxococcota bacterium]